MTADLDMLVEMGFARPQAERALQNGGSLQNAVDWLEKHADMSVEDADVAIQVEKSEASTGPEAEAQSLICNDCQRQLRGVAEAEYHASKTGHENFAESTTAIKPLTEEEKKAKLDGLRQKLAAKRAGAAEEDKATAQRNEEIRRKSTKETQDLKEDLAKKQQLKDAAAKKREKQDEAAAKQRIRDKIAADKEERRLKAERDRIARANPQAANPLVADKPPIATAKPSTSHAESRLRLIIPNGSLTRTFAAEATLFEVASAITQDQPGFEPSSFTQNFPKKTFDAVDFGSSLKELNLVPSASLIVR